jgi:hypothetical protein
MRRILTDPPPFFMGVSLYGIPIPRLRGVSAAPGSVQVRNVFIWRSAMPTVRLRVSASEDDNRELMNALQSIEGIEHVEEVGDLMPHGDDDDSSSAGLPDDASPGFHQLEIEASNEEGVRRINALVEQAAERMDGAIEIVEEF